MSGERLTLGTYTPRPGSASGIADYAVTSSAAISTLVDVQFIALGNYASPIEFDHVLYHMGGGRNSVAAFWAAAERPGPVILHEHVLSQFFVENHDLLDPDTNRIVRDAFGAALGREFRRSLDLAELMERERHLQYLDLGLERMIIDRATVVFTHSHTALAMLRERYGSARVQPLEFPVWPLLRWQRHQTRAELGIPATATVFGSFGFGGRHKRLPQVLRAWSRLRVPADIGRLLVVGDGTSRVQPLADPSTTVLGYIESGCEFRRLLSAVDVGVQLRWPSLGETSGVIAQLLASDVPVVTSTESVLPMWASDELVHIVHPGPHEVDELAELMAGYLARRPVGRGRRQHAQVPSWSDAVLTSLGIGAPADAVGSRAIVRTPWPRP
jgi:glycosyltransferase involved in cell wall biosynthesis